MAICRCDRLAARVLRFVGTDASGEGGIGDRDSLGMLVSGVMLLGMDLFVLLEVLGALERFLAYLAGVRLERCVDWGARELVIKEQRGHRIKSGTSEMGGDVIPLGAGSATVLPMAGEAEVVRGSAANVVVAEVVVETLRVVKRPSALSPPAWERLEAGARGLAGRWPRVIVRLCVCSYGRGRLRQRRDKLLGWR